MTEIINHTMWLQRQQFLHAKPYERTASRRGYGNGYKPKKWKSPISTLELSVPKTSNPDEPFYQPLLERGKRSDRAVCLLMAEKYVNEMATRKVVEVLKELGLENVSASQVRRVTRKLDTHFQAWREREFECSYEFIRKWVKRAEHEESRAAGDTTVLSSVATRRLLQEKRRLREKCRILQRVLALFARASVVLSDNT